MPASALRSLRLVSLALAKGCGAFRLALNSKWRNQRLLILCYHGISLEEEHLWRPATYIHPKLFEQRLNFLSVGRYNVLPLGEAIQRLYRRDLPPRSVAITFDDGAYDFYVKAFPLLKQHGFPATVYQTTFYSDYDYPIFHLICSYMLWKRRGKVLDTGGRLGLPNRVDLTSERSRQQIAQQLWEQARKRHLSAEQRNATAAELAGILDIDYTQILSKRILQLMHPGEIEELSRQGIDFQLHTHRHRTPLDEALFRREIEDNRNRLQSILTGKSMGHFCYPSGVYEREFLPWLQKEEVVSATTCDPGLASQSSDPLLLPRFIDTSETSDLEFEGWLSGAASFLSRNRARFRSKPRQVESVKEPAYSLDEK